MINYNELLYQNLQELKVLDGDILERTYKESVDKKLDLASLLRSRDLLSDQNLGTILADIRKLPFVNLRTTEIDKRVLDLLPYEVAKAQQAICFGRDNGIIKLATCLDDSQLPLLLEKKTGDKVKLYYSTKEDLEGALNHYDTTYTNKFEELITKATESELSSDSSTALIDLVEAIIEHAENNKASDIHIEPGNDNSIIRFRIDGILHDILTLPSSLHERLVTRLKVMARLRTDEHLSAQDGKIVLRYADGDLDIRTSIVPVGEGEKVVLRILSARTRQFALPELGLTKTALSRVESAYQASHGMILSTGPTGSGKTTTLYGILKLLNRREVNIMTIEDPVEYDLAGVNQIQVNPKTNLTFASGVRSIVRQDPDIILVGEIRDEETAGIAVNSAMTGHLVLSTIHTNTAATTFPRLIDLGVEPFLIASTVNVIIGQRLIRKICSACKVSSELKDSDVKDKLSTGSIKAFFGKEKTIRVYSGKGCSICHNSGYKDRLGIFEVLVVTDEIRQLIINRADANTIESAARKDGMVTMLEDGLSKVRDGLTTIDEILRVTKE